VDDTILAPVVEAVTEPEIPEGDSQTKGDLDVVEETPVTADATMPLDEMKDKLKQFVNKVYPMQFTSGPAQTFGFDVPKVDSAIIDNVLPTTKGEFAPVVINTPEEVVEEPEIVITSMDERPGDYVKPPEEVEIPFGVSVDDWNKLIAEAEAAVEAEKPVTEVAWTDEIQKWKQENPEGDIFEEQRKFDQGLISVLPWDTSAKYKLFPDLIEHKYVQNEEQDNNTLWKNLQTLSQEDYQHKVQENQAKENDDGQNNSNKSA
jgi:hypothetical protein